MGKSKNDASKVSAGKPAVVGAIYTAPVNSTLPTKAKEDLDPAFQCVGYISNDGVANDNSPERETTRAWGGDPVNTSQTEKDDTYKFTMIEALNVNVLKAVYGEKNVSGDLATGITIRANSQEQPNMAWVVDMILKGDVPKRIVIPSAAVTAVGTITYADSSVIGYETTISAEPWADYEGDTHREFIGGASE
nr:phage tail protein [uncultured Dysosmobacter sp.]